MRILRISSDWKVRLLVSLPLVAFAAFLQFETGKSTIFLVFAYGTLFSIGLGFWLAYQLDDESDFDDDPDDPPPDEMDYEDPEYQGLFSFQIEIKW